ncbi:MAG: tetratricopeptide repeat protein [Candidatus Xenobia bacterium]
MRRGVPRALLLLLLAACLAQASREVRPPLQDRYRQAVTRFYLLDTGGAMSILQELMQSQPQDPMPHYLMSRALARNGRSQEALQESETAVQLCGPQDCENWYLVNAWGWRASLSTAHISTRGMQEARSVADQGICLYPDNAEMYLLRGDLEDDPVRATPYYLAALAVQPDHPWGRSWHPTVPPPPAVEPRLRKPLPEPEPARGARPLSPGLGGAHLPACTSNPQAQAQLDQGLNCYYSYVPTRARPDFTQAARLDPACAMAWWGVSLCGRNTIITPLEAATKAYNVARALGTEEEQRWCAIRLMQLQGASQPSVDDALDAALAEDPRNATLWVWRATAAGFLGQTDDVDLTRQRTPFLLAAWRFAPDDPGVNQELEHAYLTLQRPLLAWPYARAWTRTAPAMPHAWYMQARVAVDLGRWSDAVRGARKAVQLALAGQPEPNRSQDVNMLVWTLLHQGCFEEAHRAPPSPDPDLGWTRLYRMAVDVPGLARHARRRRHEGAGEGWYAGALADIQQGHFSQARQFIAALEKRSGNRNPIPIRELRARFLLATRGKDGLHAMQALAKQVDANPREYPWGQRAYFDELLGQAELAAGHVEMARRAFLLGLTRDSGSVVCLVGLQVVSELTHDAAGVTEYEVRARRLWQRADPGALERWQAHLRAVAAGQAQPL